VLPPAHRTFRYTFRVAHRTYRTFRGLVTSLAHPSSYLRRLFPHRRQIICTKSSGPLSQ
jgi:hypothetical protein